MIKIGVSLCWRGDHFKWFRRPYIFTSARINVLLPLPTLSSLQPFSLVLPVFLGHSQTPVDLASPLQGGTMPSGLDPRPARPIVDRQTDVMDKWLKSQQTTFITLRVSLCVLCFVPSLRTMSTILSCPFCKWEFDLENKWNWPSFKHPQGRTRLVYQRLFRPLNF